MNKCILCADTAEERKYFFEDEPLCEMHYAEYLEFLIDDMKEDVTSKGASTAFNKYKLTLESKLLSEGEQGNIEIELYADVAPLAVENFTTHIKNGYYNGIIFHRIIQGFMYT